MTNFDFLLAEPKFNSFASVAVSAEQLLHIDSAAAVLNCRRALEFAVKWMYSADNDLEFTGDDRLKTLIDNDKLKMVVGEEIWFRMKMIRDLGNIAAHDEKTISKERAMICIKHLFYVMDFVACCYSDKYSQPEFDETLLELTAEEALSFVTEKTFDFEKVISDNYTEKEKLTARRIKNRQEYIPKPVDLSERERLGINLYSEDE